MASNFSTAISGLALSTIIEETCVRLNALKDEPGVIESGRLQVLEAQIERLDFIYKMIDEDQMYDMSLDDWDRLNAAPESLWILVA